MKTHLLAPGDIRVPPEHTRSSDVALRRSMERHGLLQPILVTHTGAYKHPWDLVAGARRLDAARASMPDTTPRK